MRPTKMYLLSWNDHYGCEGNGHVYVGIFNQEEDAALAAATWSPPSGYVRREGSYDVELLPLNPTSPNEFRGLEDNA